MDSMTFRGTFVSCFAVALFVFSMSGTAHSQEWSNRFAETGPNGSTLAVLADESGACPVVFAGGTFTKIGDQEIQGVGRFDGQRWEQVGGDFSDTSGAYEIRVLSFFDAGNGPELYAAGLFDSIGGVTVNNIARFDGAAWQPLGAGTQNGSGAINTLEVFDDGSGPALYAAGDFTSIGGVNARDIARWNGVSWSTVGGATAGSGSINALKSATLNGVTSLFVGGNFTAIGGVAANNIAQLTGFTFAPLGTGVNDDVLDLEVYGQGNAARLVAGGRFTAPGARVAAWNGSTWSPLSTGSTHSVKALHAADIGAGSELFAERFGNTLARWNGTTWSTLAAPLVGDVDTFTDVDFGSGRELMLGGSQAFSLRSTTTGALVSHLARVRSGVVMPVSRGLNTLSPISGFAAVASGPAAGFYAAQQAGGPLFAPELSFLSRWNGWRWVPLAGSGLADSITAMTDGPQDYVFVAGRILPLSNDAAVFRYDGQNFVQLPGAFTSVAAGGSPSIRRLVVHPIGGVDRLVAFGNFSEVGGVSALKVAMWNGSFWQPLGNGIAGQFLQGGISFDDGNGAVLYAYGNIAGGVQTFDGVNWTVAAGGLPASVNGSLVYDDGSGPKLHINDYRLEGGSWVKLGAATGDDLNGNVSALEAFDDGSGMALYAFGALTLPSQGVSSRLARWNGTTWQAVDVLPQGTTLFANNYAAMAAYDDGSGDALWLGGEFRDMAGTSSFRVARYGRPEPRVLLHRIGSTMIQVENVHTVPGREYFNLFVLEDCIRPDLVGPYFGLCAADLGPLLTQLFLPLETPPFHYVSFAPSRTFGPYFLPPCVTVQALCLEYTSGTLSVISQIDALRMP